MFYIQKINLSSLDDVKDAASIVIELSNIMREAIEANKDKNRESKETIEKLIVDLREAQSYIEDQLVKRMSSGDWEVGIVKAILVEICNLSNNSLSFSPTLSLFILMNGFAGASRDKKNQLLMEVCKVKEGGVHVIRLVKYIVQQGADINSADILGGTPLTYACESGRVEVVKYLVEKGAGAKLTNQDWITLLMKACESGNVELVRYLAEQEASAKLTNQNWDNLLMIACIDRDVEILQVFLETGKIAPEECVKALKVVRGDPVIEALLTQYLSASSIRMEDTESNQNFTPNQVPKAESSSAALHR
jgi:ankyrin repeat protein